MQGCHAVDYAVTNTAITTAGGARFNKQIGADYSKQTLTPGGLIEGIADYVRLKANYAPSHWVQPGQGDRWDQGYDVTARFLDYLTTLRNGFVAELNKKMRNGYNERFFFDLLGKTVSQLWSEYKAKYGK
ncbi:hypothetical protein Patl1_35404 [Pistacia atlantica]|nr:hypothetical protein Patl1_35404 [Pistacia atlantica]